LAELAWQQELQFIPTFKQLNMSDKSTNYYIPLIGMHRNRPIVRTISDYRINWRFFDL